VPLPIEWLIAALVALAGPANFFLQVLMAARYRGRWRAAALLPLIVMPLAVHAGFAYAAGSNAWPAPLVLASPIAFGYLLAVGVANAASSGGWPQHSR
jgi:hypothetical protein